MKYKLTTIILLSFIFIVIILGGFEIRKKYNIYQEDYIYIFIIILEIDMHLGMQKIKRYSKIKKKKYWKD